MNELHFYKAESNHSIYIMCYDTEIYSCILVE